MHQIPFLLGLNPNPAGGVFSAPPDPLGVFKGTTSSGEGEVSEKMGKGRKEE